MAKPKKLNFEIIEPVVNGKQTEPYRIMEEIREKWHDDIRRARIALAWRKETKPDVDGHLVLGRCVKLSDLHREAMKLDFVIVLNKEVWDDARFGPEKKAALVDHELCHAAKAESEDGEPKVYEDGRPVFRTRKHDIEEFRAIIERHGCYKHDLEKFAESILKKYKPETARLFGPDDSSPDGGIIVVNDPEFAKALGDLVKPIDGKGITSMSMEIPGRPETKVTITADDAKNIRRNVKRIQEQGNIGV